MDATSDSPSPVNVSEGSTSSAGLVSESSSATAVRAEKDIKVVSVNLKTEHNAKCHHTEEYEVPNLIVRRGQQFDIVVQFNQPVNLDEHTINIEVHLGEKPSVLRATKLKIPLGGENLTKWKIKIQKQSDNMVALVIIPPATGIVGRFTLCVSKTIPGKTVLLWQSKTAYLLYNPWCEADSVYLDDEKQREEYVLNDTGFIYVGSCRNPSPRPWNFGQFDDAVLEASFYLLEQGIRIHERNNPLMVTRRISAMTNCQDDSGVLVGNWSGDYEGGSSPCDWLGSVAILEQYMKTKRPVCYGQCWVFSGLTTTVLRCLGIPTRSVTNFSSAHDTDRSMTIDNFWDENFEAIEHLNSDSVWNFHVWNECWMTRPDLPHGFGGWQLLDGTPQETSDGIYQTGPASLAAVKEGHVYYNYDTEFAFAEVNADKVHWVASLDANQEVESLVKVRTERRSVGRFVLTKAVGVKRSENVTCLYKYPEGSDKERLSVHHACSHGSRPETYITDKELVDVDCDIIVKDVVKIGEDFDVIVKVTNQSDEKCTVDIRVSCHVCRYTGIVIKKCKEMKFDGVVVEPKSSSECTLKLCCMDYRDLLVEHASMKIYVIGRVAETKQIFAEQDDFSLQTPELNLQLQNPNSSPKVGKEFNVVVSFKNDLGKVLTGGTFSLEGPGIQKTMTLPYRSPSVCQTESQISRFSLVLKFFTSILYETRPPPPSDIKPNETGSVTFTLTPKKAGFRRILANLHCKELTGVNGFLDLDVLPADEAAGP
ncbi:protein-glutamine gamma-glutamyltransferase K-like [Saccoglossus kowalevskii]|uniref:Protein-glutamine gamma-glutamyltransferase K-like n=1 Tax=Saccoglossus kowalevskii TaxID=10224 RepID=A0ABM0GVK0_SACKO|nr:PREDICTED: protein-glutamine gamma-glutamyltransferase K-like [Saccoglossus kowalevskii]